MGTGLGPLPKGTPHPMPSSNPTPTLPKTPMPHTAFITSPPSYFHLYLLLPFPLAYPSTLPPNLLYIPILHPNYLIYTVPSLYCFLQLPPHTLPYLLSTPTLPTLLPIPALPTSSNHLTIPSPSTPTTLLHTNLLIPTPTHSHSLHTPTPYPQHQATCFLTLPILHPTLIP